MSEHTAEKDALAHGLTDAERLRISAVVHQNYSMPDVFEVVEAIIRTRGFYNWEIGFTAGVTAERGGRVENPWNRATPPGDSDAAERGLRRGWFADWDDEDTTGYGWQPCLETGVGHIPCFEVWFKTKAECEAWITENVVGVGWLPGDPTETRVLPPGGGRA